MIRASVILILVLFSISFSCKKSSADSNPIEKTKNDNGPVREHINTLNRYLNEISFNEKVLYAIIIPSEGCSYCSDIALDFAKNFSIGDSIAFILTAPGRKKAQLKLKQTSLNPDFIIFDVNHLAFKLSLVTENPVLLKFEMDTIYRTTLTPDVIYQELDEVKIELTDTQQSLGYTE